MALLVCTDCTARYSVGAPRCPQCGSTEHVEEGAQDMPKITRHGGPSVADEEVVVETENGRELAPVSEADPDKVVTDEGDEGGEGSSAGSSSETSSETQSSTPGTSETPTPSPVRVTGSRSAKAQKQTPGSTAGSADGGPAAGSSATGSADK
ncbi:putative protein OS=Streptomyces fumanus OX=67302 GN=GCM10018772_05250 PE=4 SV=1 [Streptomyces fumanus]|uniref:Uncharacterized protein n=2 Tax=Streptomyces fumanus TaxID=67302 RepID=A0A919DVI0_9ACTN|nr:hypothetical protein GCM10018772_05250 [Streptomyces fumanus]